MQLFENEVFDCRQTYLLTPINIISCVFQLCVSNLKEGGAIFALCGLSVIQSQFLYNSAPIGGSVYAGNLFSSNHSVYKGGYAKQSAAISHYDAINESILLFSNCFSLLQSSNFSCFLHTGKGNSEITNCNFSSCTSDRSPGGFGAIGNGESRVFNCVFSEISAYSKACIIFQDLSKVSISQVVFWFIRAAEDSFDESSVMSIKNIVPSVTITNCLFQEISKTSRPYLYAENAFVLVSHCCVACTIDEFTNNSNSITIDPSMNVPSKCSGVYPITKIGRMGLEQPNVIKSKPVVFFFIKIFLTGIGSACFGLVIGLAVTGKLSICLNNMCL